MPIKNWMIYGAYGYSGQLIAELAQQKGMRPMLAGRNAAKTQAVAERLDLPWCAFDLDNSTAMVKTLRDVDAVIHCAGPFSATSAPMIAACLEAQTHYFDISGEMAVFEHANSAAINRAAKAAGVVVCAGVGFDVVPTDCLAKALSEKMPDATELHLGFAGSMSLSPGTAKTMVEGLAKGTFARRNGKLINIPLTVRDIDYGSGPLQSMAVSWGDISTAFYSTGIPNITVSWPASNSDLRNSKLAAWLRPIIRLPAVQRYLKRQVDKKVVGPDASSRDANHVDVWGEATNAKGETVSARVKTANGYTLTQLAPVAIVEAFAESDLPCGSLTPSILMGKDFVSTLSGSTEISYS